MDIVAKIKAAVKYAGLTNSAVAERLGSSKSAFSQRLKHGKISTITLEKIAEALGAKLIIKFIFDDGTEI